jgi:hypothetical protein
VTARDDRTEAVRALLTETGAAHGVYETTELNGVYDQAWPSWYATYAVEHGIGELLGQAVAADQLAEFLATSFTDFKENEPGPSEGWAAYTARRITIEL